mgnify:FL=1
MIPDLTGKGVFITGAAGGIGRKLVGAFLSAGASVTAADISDHGLRDLSAAHAEDGLRIRALDVGSSSDCQAAIFEAGQVDILINNAGASMGLIRDDHLDRLVNLDEVTPELWDHFVATNLSGPWYLTKACVPTMRTRGWGRIINVTTSFFTMLRPMFHPYGPPKAGLEAMSAGHAGELAKDGITVNVVVPGGPTDTPMVPAVTKMARSLMIPPAAMVPPILWLCSADADAVTGNRYVAAKWDADVSIADACAASEAPIAWPELASSPVWPGANPDKE